MNKYLRNLAIAVALAFAVAFVLMPGHKTERRQPQKQNSSDSAAAVRSTVPPDSLDRNRRLTATHIDGAAQAQAGETDENMIEIKESVRSYRNAFGENPIGTNAEISKTLAGGNNRKARFVDPDLKMKDGQMVDQWGHPYFFHQLSRTQMEIRSAGPDGVMWTKDDEVIR